MFAAADDFSRDKAWELKLQRWLRESEVADCVQDAMQPMYGLMKAQCGYCKEDLDAIVFHAEQTMTAKLQTLNLSSPYPVKFATAIYLYTMEDPPWYKLVNSVLNSPTRRDGPSNTSVDLTHCRLFIKLLDTALAELPSEFRYEGQVHRGVKWVFPSPTNHNPSGHFFPGRRLSWCSFRSASTDVQVVQNSEEFAGRAGLRTIIQIEGPCGGFLIDEFSAYREKEVLFRLLPEFEVVAAVKHIGVCPASVSDVNSKLHTGDPDVVIIHRLDAIRSTSSSCAEPAAVPPTSLQPLTFYPTVSAPKISDDRTATSQTPGVSSQDGAIMIAGHSDVWSEKHNSSPSLDEATPEQRAQPSESLDATTDDRLWFAAKLQEKLTCAHAPAAWRDAARAASDKNLAATLALDLDEVAGQLAQSSRDLIAADAERDAANHRADTIQRELLTVSAEWERTQQQLEQARLEIDAVTAERDSARLRAEKFERDISIMADEYVSKGDALVRERDSATNRAERELAVAERCEQELAAVYAQLQEVSEQLAQTTQNFTPAEPERNAAERDDSTMEDQLAVTEHETTPQQVAQLGHSPNTTFQEWGIAKLVESHEVTGVEQEDMTEPSVDDDELWDAGVSSPEPVPDRIAFPFSNIETPASQCRRLNVDAAEIADSGRASAAWEHADARVRDVQAEITVATADKDRDGEGCEDLVPEVEVDPLEQLLRPAQITTTKVVLGIDQLEQAFEQAPATSTGGAQRSRELAWNVVKTRLEQSKKDVKEAELVLAGLKEQEEKGRAGGATLKGIERRNWEAQQRGIKEKREFAEKKLQKNRADYKMDLQKEEAARARLECGNRKTPIGTPSKRKSVTPGG